MAQYCELNQDTTFIPIMGYLIYLPNKRMPQCGLYNPVFVRILTRYLTNIEGLEK